MAHKKAEKGITVTGSCPEQVRSVHNSSPRRYKTLLTSAMQQGLLLPPHTFAAFLAWDIARFAR